MPRSFALALALAPAGCGSDAIDHEGGTTDFFGSVSTAETTSSGSGPGQANFPEPASTACGGLPAGHPPIDDLASAWLVVAVPDAVDADGTPIPSGMQRLRLTDRALEDCSAAFFTGPSDGADELPLPWGFALSFAEDELAIGTMELDELADPRGEFASASSPGATDLAGTIEIFETTPDCVIGEIRDMPVPRYGRVISGGFVAQVCRRECIPLAGQSCWQ